MLFAVGRQTDGGPSDGRTDADGRSTLHCHCYSGITKCDEGLSDSDRLKIFPRSDEIRLFVGSERGSVGKRS